MLNSAIEKAYSVLDGAKISKELCLELATLEGENILDLTSLANKVKNKFKKDTHICTIINAKSGNCSENCKFCAQSSHNKAEIESFDFVSCEQIVNKAGEAYRSGARSFGIVTSGRGYRLVNEEFKEILRTIDLIHEKFPGSNVCTALGNLSEITAAALAEHNIAHYNLNIQTNPDKYNTLVSTTHNVNDRIETIKLLHKYNIKTCSGGIIGLGETINDRIEMAFSLKEMKVDIIPLNVLIPVSGTPLENSLPLSVAEIAKTFALFRLINPGKTLKFAAGRETVMKDFQALLMLSGANGFLTGGYLTTRGRMVSEDLFFEKELLKF